MPSLLSPVKVEQREKEREWVTGSQLGQAVAVVAVVAVVVGSDLVIII